MPVVPGDVGWRSSSDYLVVGKEVWNILRCITRSLIVGANLEIVEALQHQEGREFVESDQVTGQNEMNHRVWK